MDKQEAHDLGEACLPELIKQHRAGLLASPAYAALSAAGDETRLVSVESRVVARLWGGMGSVHRLALTLAGPAMSVPIIVKRVELPARCSSIGDKRKEQSYLHEINFYSQGHAAALIRAGAQVPAPLLTSHVGARMTIAMTELPGQSVGGLNEAQTEAMLRWLALLHAMYWGPRADAAVTPVPTGAPQSDGGGGLQQQGCYWYLDTRPDELASMSRAGWEGRLKRAAAAIDARLKADGFMTACHGDAKAANMLFCRRGGAAAGGGGGDGARLGDGALGTAEEEGGEEGEWEVLMYDMQYIGRGSAAKDLAYVLTCASSCGEPAFAQRMLGFYHSALAAALHARGEAPPPPLEQLRDSYDLSCCDLGRWMAGWGWWGHDDALQETVRAVLQRLDGGVLLESEDEYGAAMATAFAFPVAAVAL
jgi:hypothetical protein